jgi:hypothetical protein
MWAEDVAMVSIFCIERAVMPDSKAQEGIFLMDAGLHELPQVFAVLHCRMRSGRH